MERSITLAAALVLVGCGAYHNPQHLPAPPPLPAEQHAELVQTLTRLCIKRGSLEVADCKCSAPITAVYLTEPSRKRILSGRDPDLATDQLVYDHDLFHDALEQKCPVVAARWIKWD